MLPHDNGKEAKDHCIQRSCDGDDHAADFIVGHEVLTAEPPVDVDLTTSENGNRENYENGEQDSSRHTVKQINQGNAGSTLGNVQGVSQGRPPATTMSDRQKTLDERLGGRFRPVPAMFIAVLSKRTEMR